jgi:hypothetical protein
MIELRVSVRVWVNVRVGLRALTTVIFSLEPSSSHLSRCCRPFWPTAIQVERSVSHKLLTRQDKVKHNKGGHSANTTQHNTRQEITGQAAHSSLQCHSRR